MVAGKMAVWCVFCLCLFCCGSEAQSSTSAYVIKIIDGDSIVVNTGSKDITVRLWGIDTPEYRQHYANAAKNETRRLLNKKSVKLEVKDWDKYGRMVALVRLNNGVLINEELVKSGYAWVHVYYCKEAICKKWKAYEKQAQQARLGLWHEKNPVAPWVFKRKGKYGKQ
jgi:endonuclease YncB( thermonuclease family)